MRAGYRSLAGLLLLLGCAKAAAHELAIDFILGGDSNPNQLADTLDADMEAYSLGRVRFSHEAVGTGYYYSVQGRNDFYTRDKDGVTNAANAEEIKLSAVGGFSWSPTLSGRGAANFTAELFYHRQDGIFVDRRTGALARFSGAVIDDRFDAKWQGLQVAGKVPLSPVSNFIFALQSFDKDYESYANLGLNNLDYEQTEFDLGFEKHMGSRTTVRTTIGGGTRSYVDRRARTEDGALMDGSNLEFALLEMVGELDIQLSGRWNLQLGLDLDQRKDNESGYYDLTETMAFSHLRYRNEDFVNFLFTAAYVNREFDNIDDNVLITLEEEQKERDGYRVGTELVRNVSGWVGYNVDLLLGLNYESFGHDNLYFNYDRSQFYIGARWHAY